MSNKRFMVIVIQYNGQDEEIVENLVESITNPIENKDGKVRRVYQGSEERIVTALENVLGLTK